MEGKFLPFSISAACLSIAFSAGTYFFKFDSQADLIKRLEANYNVLYIELIRIEDHLKMKPINEKGE